MEGPRPPLENEHSEVIEFLNKTLRPQSGWSILEEYPSALDVQNLPNIRIIKSEKEILAHATWKPFIVKTPLGIFKVAGIGSVVTSDLYRQQGLSRSILEEVLASAQSQGCDFAILWTNLFDFYRKFGFELGGTELIFEFTKPLDIPDLQGVRILEGNQVSPEAIYRVYMQHTVSTVRTLEDFRRYLKIPNSRVYTLWNQAGPLEAYAVEGKGADLNGYIHEWGGGVSRLLPLFNYMLRTQNRPLHLITPGHSQNLVQKLKDLGITPFPGNLGMIKILNPNNLFGKITRLARNQLGVADFVLEKRGSSYCIGTPENLFSTDSETEFTKWIFGPQKPSEFYTIKNSTIDLLDQILPIQMWVWGWDSI